MGNVSDRNCAASLQLLKVIPEDDDDSVASILQYLTRRTTVFSDDRLDVNKSFATKGSREPSARPSATPSVHASNVHPERSATTIKKEMGDGMDTIFATTNPSMRDSTANRAKSTRTQYVRNSTPPTRIPHGLPLDASLSASRPNLQPRRQQHVAVVQEEPDNDL